MIPLLKSLPTLIDIDVKGTDTIEKERGREEQEKVSEREGVIEKID
jgi:hypothetical protein